MKLSELQPGPVERVEGYEGLRGDLARKGEEQAQAWRIGAAVGLKINEVAVERSLTVTRQQMLDADAEAKIQQAKLERELEDKKYWTGKELAEKFGGWETVPEEVRKQFTEDSTEIPGFMVNGHIYAKESEKIVDKASERVGMPAFREEFNKSSKAQAQFNSERIKATQAKESDDFEVAKMLRRVDAYVNQGMFPEAEKEIQADRILTPGQKEKALQKLQVEKGEWWGIDPLRGTDMAKIDSTIAGFESGNNTFTVKDQYNREKTADVSGLNATQRKERLNGLREWKHALERAANEADKNKNTEGDLWVANQVLTAVTSNSPLRSLTGLAKYLAQHPELPISKTSRQYVAGLVVGKQNIEFNRQHTYGVTPDKSALAAVNALVARGPNSGAELEGPDGVKWGKLEDLTPETVLKYFQSYGQNDPAKTKQAMVDIGNALKGKPIDAAATRRDVDDVMEASGILKHVSPGKETEMRKANLKIYAETEVAKEDARRMADPDPANRKRMNQQERREFIQKLFTDPKLGEKVNDPDAFIFSEDAAPKFSGIPDGDLSWMSELRSTLIKLHGGKEPWAIAGPEVAAAHKRIKDYMPYVEEVTTSIKTDLNPAQKLVLSGEVDLWTRTEAYKKFKEDMRRPPKRSETVKEYFRQNYPGAASSIEDPRKSAVKSRPISPTQEFPP